MFCPTSAALRPSSWHLTLLALACLGAAGAAVAQGRSTLELIPLNGNFSNSAVAISPEGYLVGDFVGGPRLYSVFLRAPDGTVRDLSASSGYTQANAVNDRGQVAGRTIAAHGADSLAAVWSPDTGWLNGLPGTVAHAINNLGEVVTSNSTSNTVWFNAPGRAAVVTGLRYDYLIGLNDRRQVAGVDAATGRSAIWSPGTGVQTLVGLSTGSWLGAINGNGVAVGGAGGRVLKWAVGEQPELIGPGDATDMQAYGINDAGQVVGRHYIYPGSAFLWSASGGVTNLQVFAPGGPAITSAVGISRYAQIAVNAGQAGLLTLHPDWQGGNGSWDDGRHWNWAGTGVAAAQVGRMHDVVIAPAGNVIVSGPSNGRARTLVVGGTWARSATLDLAGGQIELAGTGYHGDTALKLSAGGVLRGSGQISGSGAMVIDGSATVRVGASERLGLGLDSVANAGVVRVQGTAYASAELAVSGAFANYWSGRVEVTRGELSLGSGSNQGQIVLQDATVTLAESYTGFSNGPGGQIAVSAGTNRISGYISNEGQIGVGFADALFTGNLSNRVEGVVVVSNGGRATFLGSVYNEGELRVSAGGAANLFGDVSGTGRITGDGAVRFEGGLGGGTRPGLLRVAPTASFAGGAQMRLTLGGAEAGQYDQWVFDSPVTLEGTQLVLGFTDGYAGSAGDHFSLFAWGGGVSGSFGSLMLPGLSDGLVWDTSALYGSGVLSITAVPEPATGLLLLGGLGALLMRRRRPMV
jgi:hypothetical protein